MVKFFRSEERMWSSLRADNKVLLNTFINFAVELFDWKIKLTSEILATNRNSTHHSRGNDVFVVWAGTSVDVDVGNDVVVVWAGTGVDVDVG